MTKEREEYLAKLSEDYGVPLSIVHEMAAILGPNEDYDGLVSALNDVEEQLAE